MAFSSAAFSPFPPHTTHSSTHLTHQQAHDLLSTFLTTADSNPAYRPDATLSTRGPISTSAGAGSSSGGANLTLANLRRVLLGIEGRQVGGAGFTVGKDVEEDTQGSAAKRRKIDHGAEHANSAQDLNDDDTAVDTPRKKRPRREVEVNDDGEVIIEEPEEREGGDEGWQEKDDFEMQQDDLLVAEAEDHPAQHAVGEGTTSGEVVDMAEEILIKSARDVKTPKTKEKKSEKRNPVADEREFASTEDTDSKPLDKAARKKAKKARQDEEKKQRAKERSRASRK